MYLLRQERRGFVAHSNARRDPQRVIILFFYKSYIYFVFSALSRMIRSGLNIIHAIVQTPSRRFANLRSLHLNIRCGFPDLTNHSAGQTPESTAIYPQKFDSVITSCSNRQFLDVFITNGDELKLAGPTSAITQFRKLFIELVKHFIHLRNEAVIDRTALLLVEPIRGDNPMN